MAHAQAAITVNRNTVDVFNFLADGMNNPKWRPNVTEIQKITDGPVGVGTKFRQRLKGPMGRTITHDYEITVFEPGQVLGFRVIAGPARPEGRFMLVGGEGQTNVEFDLQQPPISFLQKFIDKMIQKKLDKEAAAIGNIKTLLEN